MEPTPDLEILFIEDIQRLFRCSEPKAAALMREIGGRKIGRRWACTAIAVKAFMANTNAEVSSRA